jgi:hypothetical protein
MPAAFFSWAACTAARTPCGKDSKFTGIGLV